VALCSFRPLSQRPGPCQIFTGFPFKPYTGTTKNFYNFNARGSQEKNKKVIAQLFPLRLIVTAVFIGKWSLLNNRQIFIL